MPFSPLNSAVTSWCHQVSGRLLLPLKNCSVERRQFCDDERTNERADSAATAAAAAAVASTSTAGCRPAAAAAAPSPTRLRPARAVLRATAGRRKARRTGQPVCRPSNWTASRPRALLGRRRRRLNYLPRSHAHVDGRCILMLRRRNGHLFATG